MSAVKTQARFESTYRTWVSRLSPLPDEEFARRPDDGGWSVGQVCHHVGDVSDMLLGNAEKCAAGDGVEKGFQFMPAMICAVGSLPPARIKVPELPDDLQHLAQPQPMTRAQALERLESVAGRMRELKDGIAAASTRVRREHPAGGWMHARQWFQMNEMHVRHHLRQLARLGHGG